MISCLCYRFVSSKVENYCILLEALAVVDSCKGSHDCLNDISNVLLA